MASAALGTLSSNLSSAHVSSHLCLKTRGKVQVRRCFATRAMSGDMICCHPQAGGAAEQDTRQAPLKE